LFKYYLDMEFSFHPQFSYEISVMESPINHISDVLNEKLATLEDEALSIIYVGPLCVSENFLPFFKPKRSKYNHLERSFEFEFSLDFLKYSVLDYKKRQVYIGSEFLRTLTKELARRSIQGFDHKSFLFQVKEVMKNNELLDDEGLSSPNS
jgi:hypothetical protein